MRQALRSGPSLLDRGLWWLQEHWPWLRRHLAEPSAAMFARIRLRLVAWYMGILVAILSIAGILLYVGVQAAVLAPVNDALAAFAQNIGDGWRTAGVVPCGSQFVAITSTAAAPRNILGTSYIACYDPSGQLLATSPFLSDVSSFTIAQFTRADLAQSALASGSATDTIDGGATVGAIQRYALTVRDANGAILGVVQVGAPVQEYENSLHTLASLIWIVGALTIVGAGLGGWFLAAHALEPASVAASRQRAFLADAAHELRTPLTLLRADTEALLCLHDHLPPKDVELLDDIVTESDHMSHLLGQLLTLARLDAGATHPESEIVDLSALLARVARRAQALARQQQVSMVADSTGSVCVVGDQALLEQATMILLENAIKYNRPGGSVSLRAWQRDGWAKIAVRDTGIGMDASHLAHVGERFYRADAAHTSTISGAGLGVSIARGIAALHQGTLTYTSIPDKGTTATLIVPAAEARTPKSRLLAAPVIEAFPLMHERARSTWNAGASLGRSKVRRSRRNWR
jgi:signal transduction histidine kinase